MSESVLKKELQGRTDIELVKIISTEKKQGNPSKNNLQRIKNPKSVTLIKFEANI